MNAEEANEIRIIRAGRDELDLVAPLFDSYRGFYSQPGDLARGREFLRQRMERNESVIFLAMVQDSTAPPAAAGFTQLYPIFSSVRIRAKWILNDLFVAPAFRRIGVGRRLMLRAIEFGRETGTRGLELSTQIENVSAQRLYESVGFTRNERFYTYELNYEEA